MNQLRFVDPRVDLALEHQADMLRLAHADSRHRAVLNRWRAGLLMLLVVGAPVAYFLVRAW